MPRRTYARAVTMGILDARVGIVLRKKIARDQVVARLSNLRPCLAGEAGLGTHYLTRDLLALGMP